MKRNWGHIAWIGAAAAVAGLALSPAFGAAGSLTLAQARAESPVSLGELGSIGSFTPTTSDKRLAAAYAHAVLSSSGRSFRFTPTSGSMSGRRSITVLVRAGNVHLERTLPSLGITPVAFNLDASRGWRKFALPDSVGRKDLDPVSTETIGGAANFSLDSTKQKKTRFSTNVVVDGKGEPGSAQSALAADKPFSLDVASSYSLTRNLNVTAGVRYRGTNNRLTPMTDERQDNQAVYLGTIFKF